MLTLQPGHAQLVDELTSVDDVGGVGGERQQHQAANAGTDGRLHLGTAVIHVIPAGYLCIVPAGKASQKSVALPFVDDDQRTSEVLSKLLLLSADDKIKDPTILAQIEGRQAETQA